MTTKEHRNILGILFMVYAGLQVFGGIFVALIYGGIGTFVMTSSHSSHDQTGGAVMLFAGIVVAVIMLIWGVFNALTGWKLFKQKPNVRTLAIIASIIALLNFPLGTILGIYGIVFLFGEQGKNLDYDGGNTASNFPPPPPNSWS